MCGIAGKWVTGLPSGAAAVGMQSALGLMRHRGPNDVGSEAVSLLEPDDLILGQTRLAVIDLTQGGHQPMTSADGRYVMVFNGEIYNYRELRSELQQSGHVLRTESDTEVLLTAWAQWGESCLRRLIGMFAFAVVDRAERTLTLARDAFGIKPLFVFVDSQRIAFASEIPALLELLPRKPGINLQKAHDFLVRGVYDDEEATFYRDVFQLPPAHVVRLSSPVPSHYSPRRWWWPSVEENPFIRFEDAAEAIREGFLQNVKLHLRSDVPLGSALSGGIDSSAVVCAIRHLDPDADIHTFSFVARGSDVDEERWADLVNSHIGSIAHKVLVDPQEMRADLDDMLRSQGEPFGSTSIYAQYRVFKLAREHGVTVTLDGQGADELLAGYSGYPDSRLRSLAAQRQYLEMLRFARRWAAWPGRGTKPAAVMALRAFLPDNVVHAIKMLTRRHQLTHPAEWLRDEYMAERNVRFVPTAFAPPPDVVSTKRHLAGALRQAMCGPGLGPLLRHGDRNSMRWSVESRVPFLTVDLAELCLSLPERYLLSDAGETKHVFRAAMRGIVPDALLDRRDKIGFATPEQSWLRSLGDTPLGWMDAAHDIPFLDADKAKRAVKHAIDSNAPFSYQSWRLISFCRWWELAGVTA